MSSRAGVPIALRSGRRKGPMVYPPKPLRSAQARRLGSPANTGSLSPDLWTRVERYRECRPPDRRLPFASFPKSQLLVDF
jgi:hypothetical protein